MTGNFEPVQDIDWKPFIKRSAKLWDIDPLSVQLVRDVMNRVYKGSDRNKKQLIIRFVSSERRSIEDLDEEMLWLEFLNQKASCFCRPVRSLANKLVEEVSFGGKTMHISCFHKQVMAQEIQSNACEWNASLFNKVGQLTGRLHHLTCIYERQHQTQRHSCLQETIFKENYKKYLAKDDENAIEPIELLLKKLSLLPTSNGYGLVHGDIKQDNYFIDEHNQLFLYDFDQSCLAWRIYDLVVSLYFNYAYPLCKIVASNDEKAKDYLSALLDGYALEHPVDKNQLSLIPDLLKLRECLIYLLLKKLRAKPDIINSPMLSQQLIPAMQTMKHRIIHDIPMFEIDFTGL